MLEQEPSRTALGAAGHRAAHQVLEGGRIFAYQLAIAILGPDAEKAVEASRGAPQTRGLRLFIAARSAIAEARLAEGITTRGVRQLVVLGAGLDTFAYRNPFGDRLRVFEVDHPQTQAWKRRRLAETGIAAPPSLTYAPVDFERDDLGSALAASGLDTAQRTFFVWLGVVPYLTKDAIRATLTAIAALPGGGEVAFDYSDPPASLPLDQRMSQFVRATGVAAIGEPFLSYFDPPELHALLREAGFVAIDDLGPQALIERYFRPGEPAQGLRRERGGHVLWAASA